MEFSLISQRLRMLHCIQSWAVLQDPVVAAQDKQPRGSEVGPRSSRPKGRWWWWWWWLVVVW